MVIRDHVCSRPKPSIGLSINSGSKFRPVQEYDTCNGLKSTCSNPLKSDHDSFFYNPNGLLSSVQTERA